MAAIPDPTQLRQVALFRDMGLQELAILNGLMRRQVFPAGMGLVVTEQLEDTAYVIWRGVVKVVVEQADGTEVILAILGPGELISTLTIGECSGDARSIVSLDDTTLFWIDLGGFERCLKTMPALSRNLSTVLARRVRLANERIEALAGLDVRGRIVRHLLLLAREYGQPTQQEPKGGVRIPLRLTQVDLASMVGASRNAVNHTLGELRRRQIVQTNGDHSLLIHDLPELEKLR
ncbi:MAG: family transcriptional regulator, cyclic receptor protein [Mycobacterium sp.]|jgi:CRP/FNR family cyclic AMP-dependent transcriptional regulator|nr:family transcriptional regulator, cyclic receptor protein [Mycobacterium sp.]